MRRSNMSMVRKSDKNPLRQSYVSEHPHHNQEDDDETNQIMEEPVVIKLMTSMLNKKKSVVERMEMCPNISVDKIKREFIEQAKKAELDRQKQKMVDFLRDRQMRCDKLSS